MMRLLKIELKKVMPNRAFRVLAIMYIVAMVIVSMGVMPFFQFLKANLLNSELMGLIQRLFLFMNSQIFGRISQM